MAWSYYNLKNIPAALSYAEKQVTYYNDRAKSDPADNEMNVNSDEALRENTLLDIAVFYEDGLEKDREKYVSRTLCRISKSSKRVSTSVKCYFASPNSYDPTD